MSDALLPPDELTVMIVDDVPPLLAWACRAFTRDGWTVRSAHDGSTALAHWHMCRQAGDTPRLLITDLGMPGLDGSELAQRVREMAPAVPIIVLSGLPSDADAWRKAPRDGVTFLRKPITAADLVAAARGLVGAAPFLQPAGG